MNSFKRQVSPGAAAVLVVMVLVIVQWAWWRGLVYKPPLALNAGMQPSGAAPARPDLVIVGHRYVAVDTLAGFLDPGDVDGPGYAARFDRPTGLAINPAGALYVCDTGNHKIRVVTAEGAVSTFAGSTQGFTDGPAATAKFNAPCGICIGPDGAVYVADTGNSMVRSIRDGVVSTFAQLTPAPGSTTKPLPVAIEYRDKPTPALLVLDAASKMLNEFSMDGKNLSSSAQSDSAVIRMGKGPATPISIVGSEEFPDAARRPWVKKLIGWDPVGSGALATDMAHGTVFYVRNGSAEVMAGVVQSERPVGDWRDGTGENAAFCHPTAVVSDGAKYAYVADTGNNVIRRLTLPDFLFH